MLNEQVSQNENSLFTHYHGLELYDFISSVDHKKDILRNNFAILTFVIKLQTSKSLPF